ncbi:hypothetical protein TGP89_314370 [Toxoplasma gondii p89]|uniref:Uncharacterized protein n=1 Tax=Toxoplasma gondii p89 TaxID=943119 RepID=A0A086KZN5_TOXGO|nr:hypothetical protein TGP89_314370 [Toxoplasma gondii p89]
MHASTRNSAARSSSSSLSASGGEASRVAGSSGVSGRPVLHAKKASLRSTSTRCSKPPNGEKKTSPGNENEGTPNTREAPRRSSASPRVSGHPPAERSESLSGSRKGQTHAAKLLMDSGNLSRRERPRDELSRKGGDAAFTLPPTAKPGCVTSGAEKKQATALASSSRFCCFLGLGSGGVYTPKQRRPGQAQTAKAPAGAVAVQSAGTGTVRGFFSQPELCRESSPEREDRPAVSATGEAPEQSLSVRIDSSVDVDASQLAERSRPPVSSLAACGACPPPSAHAPEQAALPCVSPLSTEDSSKSSSLRHFRRPPLSASADASFSSSSSSLSLPSSSSSSSSSSAVASSSSSSSSAFASAALAFSSSACSPYSPSPRRPAFPSSLGGFSPHSPFSVRSHGSALSADLSPKASTPLHPDVFLNFVDSAFLIFPSTREQARATAEEMLQAAQREAEHGGEGERENVEGDGGGERAKGEAEKGEGEKGEAEKGEAEKGEAEKGEGEKGEGEKGGKNKRGTACAEQGEREDVTSKRRRLGATHETSGSTEVARSEEEERKLGKGQKAREARTETASTGSASLISVSGAACVEGSRLDSGHSRVSQDGRNASFARSPLRGRDLRSAISAVCTPRVFPAWPGDEAPSPGSSLSSPVQSPPSGRAWRGRGDARAFADCLRLEAQRLAEAAKKRDLMHLLRSTSLELPHLNRHGVSLIYGPRVPGDDGFDYRVVYWGETAACSPEEKVRNQMRAQAFRERIRNLALQSPDGLLTVQQLVLDLDINMSRGWIHYAKLVLAGNSSGERESDDETRCSDLLAVASFFFSRQFARVGSDTASAALTERNAKCFSGIGSPLPFRSLFLSPSLVCCLFPRHASLCLSLLRHISQERSVHRISVASTS